MASLFNFWIDRWLSDPLPLISYFIDLALSCTKVARLMIYGSLFFDIKLVCPLLYNIWVTASYYLIYLIWKARNKLRFENAYPSVDRFMAKYTAHIIILLNFAQVILVMPYYYPAKLYWGSWKSNNRLPISKSKIGGMFLLTHAWRKMWWFSRCRLNLSNCWF